MSFPIILQETFYSCGPTCICMLCEYYGISYSKKKIFELAHTTIIGTSIWYMQKTLNYFGFSCDAVTIKNFNEYDFIFPTIAITSNEKNLFHYVVIYQKTDNFLIIGNPASGLQHVEISRFLISFTNMLIIPFLKI